MVEITSYGPWAVVTGASSGIGKAFAGHRAAAGLNLVLAARSAGDLDALGQARAGTHALVAFEGLPNMAHDAAAKAYVLNLGEALHHELAPAGVDVMVMLPGAVDTPLIDALGLRDTAIPAEAAARETIAAFLRHRPLHIPGRLMRSMTRLTPRSLSVRMNGRMLGRAARTLAQRQAARAG